MNNYFISYYYIGKDGICPQIYTGFGNLFLSMLQGPIDQESLEEFTNIVNEKAILDLGLKTISCTILYFRKV